jgi:superfamily II DNA or RNA helicase
VASTFERNARRVRLDRQLVDEERLREAQLGAAGALLAHAAVSSEPAQIVLPTGVGKSLVLMLAPYLLRANRVLVVAPGRLVRDQLANGFGSLAQLTAAGVLPNSTRAPKVKIARKLATPEHWEAWGRADVVVGTPKVLSDGYPDVTRVPRDLFDLIIFDEAHHLPAYTWTRLHEAVDARAVLLTATPVRRDGQPLPGKIAFVYPLQRAMDARVYAPVSYIPVTPAPGANKDRALAEKAKERLLSPPHRAAHSRLLVRADRKGDARALVDLYAKLDVPLGLVVSDSSAGTVDATLEKLRSGELLGLACVGSLTEGFDFPTLKIAAYHAPHRSLMPTLQFIGRLSRVTQIDGELIADPNDLSADTAVLYRSGDEWRRLLPQIVDSAIELERETRRFVDEAEGATRRVDVPWLTVAPARSVQIYRVANAPNLDQDPSTIGGQPVVQRLYQPQHRLLVILTKERARPRFATTSHLDGSAHFLHLAHWVANPGLLFISTDRPAVRHELLAAAGVLSAPLIGADDLRRLLAATNATRFFNVGLREGRPREAFKSSYETKAGSHADEALGEADRENKLLGHAMGRSGGSTGTFGVSTAKGKFWEPARAESLYAFRSWCEHCANNIRTAPTGFAPTALSRIRIADRITRYPEHPIAATLHESFLSGSWSLRLDGTIVEPMDIEIDVSRNDGGELEIALCRGGTLLSTVVANVDGSFDAPDGAQALDVETGELHDLGRRFESAMPTIYFGDGSIVTGTASSTPSIEEGTDPPTFVEGLSWDGVDTRAEVDNPAAGKITIQQAALNKSSDSATWVIADHGSGEISDLIAITRADSSLHVAMLHCKGSREAPGGRIDDLYDVVGQALRSVRRCRPGISLWVELRDRLANRAATQLRHGDGSALAGALASWSEGAAPVTTFEVTIVQPGLRRASAGSRLPIRQLLFAAQAHCFAQGVELSVWSSG